MNTNVSYTKASNGTVNLLSATSNTTNKQANNNLMDDFSNIFGNPTAGQNANPVQNNFANLFSIDANSGMNNINTANNANANNQFDLLSGFLNMDAGNKQAANANNINANAGFDLISNNGGVNSAPGSNTNDLLNSLGLVRYN